jgi:methionine-R-sulfoxide reductase
MFYRQIMESSMPHRMRVAMVLVAAAAATSVVALAVLRAASGRKKRSEPAMVSIHVFDKKGQLAGPVEVLPLVLNDDEWRKRLTPEQFRILRSSGTERPFCGTLLDNKKEGVYACAGCGLPLFASDAKFQSGTGWPSFFQPIAPGNVTELADHSHGMVRIEINCTRCGGHLGHVFPDGPPPSGRRFCLNSESLAFTTSEEVATLADAAAEKNNPAKE